jgi:hypothetical protein
MATVTVDEERIRAAIERARSQHGRAWATSYEEGIIAALEWILGDCDDPTDDA